MRRSLDVLGDPWVLLIVRDVLHGRNRYEDLRAGLGIGDAVLSRRLRAMVDAGLLERTPYRDGGRRRDAYVATDAGADLLPLLQQLALWGERHRPPASPEDRMVLFHEACGAETTSAETCSACHETVHAADMTWVKPWKHTRERLLGPGELGPVAS